MQKIQPSAFISYAHLDDRDTNKITTWYRCLAAKVTQLTGALFPVHCDRDFIGPGQDWAKEILNHLRRSMFLMPIVSPRFFGSDYCRFEVDQFLQFERRRGRSELIIPFYYEEASALSDPNLGGDLLVSMVKQRQYVDLRVLREMDTDSEAFTSLVDRVADSIAGTIRRMLAEGPMSEARAAPERPQRLVDASVPGQAASVAAAIAEAKPGDRIVVRPGLYRESIVIDKPLELIGEGEVGEIVIEGCGADTLVFDAPHGRITNLTLRQLTSEESAAHCLVIRAGRPLVDGCVITSQSLSCVSVRGKADPVLRQNTIVHGAQFGVVVQDDASGLLEDNEIDDHRIANLLIRDQADPTVRGNRISRGATFGLAIRDKSCSLIEDNDITDCDNVVVSIADDAMPTLRRNRVCGGRLFGVSIQGRAQPLLDGNEVAGHANCGVEISGEANPTLRGNRIHDNRNFGVSIDGPACALLEDNELASNRHAEIMVSKGAEPTVRRNRIRDASNYAISIDAASGGVFEGNEVLFSARAGFAVEDGSKPVLRANTVADGKRFGLLFAAGAQGVVEDNAIARNGIAGVWITDASPTLRRNRIHEGRGTGVVVVNRGAGVLEDNDVSGHGKSGVLLDETASVTLRGNRITGNRTYAIDVIGPCAATIEDNDLRGNGAGPMSRSDVCNEHGRVAGNRVQAGDAAQA
jgi:F-box protein 11